MQNISRIGELADGHLAGCVGVGHERHIEERVQLQVERIEIGHNDDDLKVDI